MWHRVRSLIVKELLAVLRDPKGRAILIVPPMVQLFVFSFAATQEVKNVHMAVLNQDYGTAARDLVARFEGSPHFSEIRYLRGAARHRPAPSILGGVLMVLHIGPDFSRQLAAGAGRRCSSFSTAGGRTRRRSSPAMRRRSFDAFDRGARRRRGDAPPPPSVVAARIWFNPNLDDNWNTVPSLVAILTMLMGLVVTALSVARERELGTFEQLLVSPLGRSRSSSARRCRPLIIGLSEGTECSCSRGLRLPRARSAGRCRCSMLAMMVLSRSR